MLRGIKSEVPYLKNSMIEHCCHTDVAVAYMGGAKTWEQAKGTLSYLEAFKSCNTYTTTLHVINSAVLKLGKLTQATKVYRGISFRTLPEQMKKVDPENLTRGGIEYGFTSCSLDQEQAKVYAMPKTEKNNTPIIESGMVTTGISTERTEPRNRKTTTMTITTASARVLTTSSMEAWMNRVAS